MSTMKKIIIGLFIVGLLLAVAGAIALLVIKSSGGADPTVQRLMWWTILILGIAVAGVAALSLGTGRPLFMALNIPGTIDFQLGTCDPAELKRRKRSLPRTMSRRSRARGEEKS